MASRCTRHHGDLRLCPLGGALLAERPEAPSDGRPHHTLPDGAELSGVDRGGAGAPGLRQPVRQVPERVRRSTPLAAVAAEGGRRHRALSFELGDDPPSRRC